MIYDRYSYFVVDFKIEYDIWQIPLRKSLAINRRNVRSVRSTHAPFNMLRSFENHPRQQHTLFPCTRIPLRKPVEPDRTTATYPIQSEP